MFKEGVYKTERKSEKDVISKEKTKMKDAEELEKTDKENKDINPEDVVVEKLDLISKEKDYDLIKETFWKIIENYRIFKKDPARLIEKIEKKIDEIESEKIEKEEFSPFLNLFLRKESGNLSKDEQEFVSFLESSIKGNINLSFLKSDIEAINDIFKKSENKKEIIKDVNWILYNVFERSEEYGVKGKDQSFVSELIENKKVRDWEVMKKKFSSFDFAELVTKYRFYDYKDKTEVLKEIISNEEIKNCSKESIKIIKLFSESFINDYNRALEGFLNSYEGLNEIEKKAEIINILEEELQKLEEIVIRANEKEVKRAQQCEEKSKKEELENSKENTDEKSDFDEKRQEIEDQIKKIEEEKGRLRYALNKLKNFILLLFGFFSDVIRRFNNKIIKTFSFLEGAYSPDFNVLSPEGGDPREKGEAKRKTLFEVSNYRKLNDCQKYFIDTITYKLDNKTGNFIKDDSFQMQEEWFKNNNYCSYIRVEVPKYGKNFRSEILPKPPYSKVESTKENVDFLDSGAQCYLLNKPKTGEFYYDVDLYNSDIEILDISLSKLKKNFKDFYPENVYEELTKNTIDKEKLPKEGIELLEMVEKLSLKEAVFEIQKFVQENYKYKEDLVDDKDYRKFLKKAKRGKLSKDTNEHLELIHKLGKKESAKGSKTFLGAGVCRQLAEILREYYALSGIPVFMLGGVYISGKKVTSADLHAFNGVLVPDKNSELKIIPMESVGNYLEIRLEEKSNFEKLFNEMKKDRKILDFLSFFPETQKNAKEEIEKQEETAFDCYKRSITEEDISSVSEFLTENYSNKLELAVNYKETIKDKLKRSLFYYKNIKGKKDLENLSILSDRERILKIKKEASKSIIGNIEAFGIEKIDLLLNRLEKSKDRTEKFNIFWELFKLKNEDLENYKKFPKALVDYFEKDRNANLDPLDYELLGKFKNPSMEDYMIEKLKTEEGLYEIEMIIENLANFSSTKTIRSLLSFVESKDSKRLYIMRKSAKELKKIYSETSKDINVDKILNILKEKKENSKIDNVIMEDIKDAIKRYKGAKTIVELLKNFNADINVYNKALDVVYNGCRQIKEDDLLKLKDEIYPFLIDELKLEFENDVRNKKFIDKLVKILNLFKEKEFDVFLINRLKEESDADVKNVIIVNLRIDNKSEAIEILLENLKNNNFSKPSIKKLVNILKKEKLDNENEIIESIFDFIENNPSKYSELFISLDIFEKFNSKQQKKIIEKLSDAFKCNVFGYYEDIIKDNYDLSDSFYGYNAVIEKLRYGNIEIDDNDQIEKIKKVVLERLKRLLPLKEVRSCSSMSEYNIEIGEMIKYLADMNCSEVIKIAIEELEYLLDNHSDYNYHISSAIFYSFEKLDAYKIPLVANILRRKLASAENIDLRKDIRDFLSKKMDYNEIFGLLTKNNFDYDLINKIETDEQLDFLVNKWSNAKIEDKRKIAEIISTLPENKKEQAVKKLKKTEKSKNTLERDFCEILYKYIKKEVIVEKNKINENESAKLEIKEFIRVFCANGYAYGERFLKNFNSENNVNYKKFEEYDKFLKEKRIDDEELKEIIKNIKEKKDDIDKLQDYCGKVVNKKFAKIGKNFENYELSQLDLKAVSSVIVNPASVEKRAKKLITDGLTRSLVEEIGSINVATDDTAKAVYSGGYKNFFKGKQEGVEFSEIREYNPFVDDLKSIDYKLSAKYDDKKLVRVREKEGKRSPVILAVDLSLWGENINEEISKKELSAQFCELISYSTEKLGNKSGLLIFSSEIEEFIPPKPGKKQSRLIADVVRYYTNAKKQANLNLVFDYLNKKLKARSNIVLISDGKSIESYKNNLEKLAARHNIMLIDIETPFGFPELEKIVVKGINEELFKKLKISKNELNEVLDLKERKLAKRDKEKFYELKIPTLELREKDNFIEKTIEFFGKKKY